MGGSNCALLCDVYDCSLHLVLLILHSLPSLLPPPSIISSFHSHVTFNSSLLIPRLETIYRVKTLNDSSRSSIIFKAWLGISLTIALIFLLFLILFYSLDSEVPLECLAQTTTSVRELTPIPLSLPSPTHLLLPFALSE